MVFPSLWFGLIPLLVACQRVDPHGGIRVEGETSMGLQLPQPNQPMDLEGLTQLPTPEALLQGNPSSRSDPFAALPTVVASMVASPVDDGEASHAHGLPMAGGVTPAVPPLDCPLQLTGVAMVNGQPQAFVEGDTGSGAIQLGDVGGASTELLAAGWSVVAIHMAEHQLILRQIPSPALVTCGL